MTATTTDITTQPAAPFWDEEHQTFQVRTSSWDGKGKGDDGTDLHNYVTVELSDDHRRVYMMDMVCGSDTFLTAAEARELALALLSMATKLEAI